MIDHLALRIKLGDEQAFELLFRKYYVRLCGFANKYFDDPEEAREVVQEVFTKIWEGREDIDPEESLRAYLFKITRNICINKLRRKQVESKYIEIYKFIYVDNKEVSPYESLIADELNDNITTALSKIPQKCRRIFDLSRVEGLKYNEIAENLHISVKTVEAQMSKALQILRLELKDYLKMAIIPLISIFL
jgi:RNA polymerase sigma-70 factor (ECF subfamily)